MFVGPPEEARRYRVDSDGAASAARGAEGAVYRAVRDSDQGIVALKCLLTAKPGDLHEYWERLQPVVSLPVGPWMRLDEAFIGSALTDEAAGPLDPSDFDVCWLVGEWIPESLEEALLTRPWEWRIYAVGAVADAVAALHEDRALVGLGQGPSLHCDIKPSNVRVRADGSVALVDFGQFSPVGAGRRGAGTPGWQAPEIALGGQPTPASDAWAVGAVGLFVLAGKRPATIAEDRMHLASALADHPNCRELVELLLEPLARVAGQRTSSLSAWAHRLREAGRMEERRLLSAAGWALAARVGALLLMGGLLAVAWVPR